MIWQTIRNIFAYPLMVLGAIFLALSIAIGGGSKGLVDCLTTLEDINAKLQK